MLAQQNIKTPGAAILLCLVVIGVATPSLAGTVDRHPAGPDPILTGAAPGACEPHPASAAYVAGTDILGVPVEPADAGGDQIAVSVANDVIVPEVLTHLPSLDRVRVQIRVAGLADTVSPVSACPGLPPLRSPR